MKRSFFKLKRTLVLVSGSAFVSLAAIAKEAFAEPPPPPPPSASAGGDLAQAAVIGVIALCGAWRLWRR